MDLIAEPWFGEGQFPYGWAEWNGHFRDSILKAQNKLDVTNIPLGELATRIAGSSDLFQGANHNNRQPWNSINMLTCHDGFTLWDLFTTSAGSKNDQPWPLGPSDGGSNGGICWDQRDQNQPAGVTLANLQRQADRTGLGLLLLSTGVPMILGGDEDFRTQYFNDNPYRLDNDHFWLNYADRDAHAHQLTFVNRLCTFRNAHKSLRSGSFYSGKVNAATGLKDITWLRENAQEVTAPDWQNPALHFLAYRLDGLAGGDDAASIYVAYNGWREQITATLPQNIPGRSGILSQTPLIEWKTETIVLPLDMKMSSKIRML